MGTFEKPQTCDVCFTLLKGLFYQGYRCLKCARVAHQECAPSMPSCGNQPPGKVFQISGKYKKSIKSLNRLSSVCYKTTPGGVSESVAGACPPTSKETIHKLRRQDFTNF